MLFLRLEWWRNIWPDSCVYPSIDKKVSICLIVADSSESYHLSTFYTTVQAYTLISSVFKKNAVMNYDICKICNASSLDRIVCHEYESDCVIFDCEYKFE